VRAATLVLALLLCPLATSGRARAEEGAAHADASLEICFAPLGRHDRRLLRSAARGAALLYGAHTTILKRRALPKSAYYAPRKRYRAEKLLDFLRDEVWPDSGCDLVVGFTSVDISTTKGEHHDWGIFGLGTIAGVSGVVSTHRLRRRASLDKQRRRTVSVTNHEIGHVLGAPHGGEPGCLMNDAEGTIRTVDHESGLLCADSRRLIESRLGHSLPRLESFDWERVLGHE
jgi:archaemetzincin